jgi:hypothetical protein
MIRCFVILCLGLLSFSGPLSAAQPTPFQKSNPDIGKFEFARSYISALGYINSVDQRWKTNSPKKMYAGDDVRIMRGFVALLIKDNMDLRIAKNFLSKYLKAQNPFIRKTTDIFMAACSTQIAINDKEKEIWDQWYAVKSNNMATAANQKAFVQAEEELALKRKESGKKIVEASVLWTKVVRSARNTNDNGKILAVTKDQRRQLLKHLDEFGKSVLDWGLKPGQNYAQASIAVLREILEDSLYTPIDE